MGGPDRVRVRRPMPQRPRRPSGSDVRARASRHAPQPRIARSLVPGPARPSTRLGESVPRRPHSGLARRHGAFRGRRSGLAAMPSRRGRRARQRTRHSRSPSTTAGSGRRHDHRPSRAQGALATATFPDLQALLALEPTKLLEVHCNALAVQHHVDSPVAEPSPLGCHRLHGIPDFGIVGAGALVTDARPIEARRRLAPCASAGWAMTDLFAAGGNTSRGHVPQRRVVHNLFGQQPLQLRVLLLERLQPSGVGHL